MAKIIAYTALLYGRSYLADAIASLIDVVDEYWVLYAASGGSHGHRPLTPCPETRDELRAIAERAAGRKLRWIDGGWLTESNQRNSPLSRDADMIFVLDSDEIWPQSLVENVLNNSLFPPAGIPPYRQLLIPCVHFWRSFHTAVVNDLAAPARVLYPLTVDHYGSKICADWGRIAHMGYAQPTEIVQWKQQVHGHRDEWRSEWFTEKWLKNDPNDCHPTNERGYWNAVPVNAWDYLPESMKEHPFANMEVIE